MKPDIPDVNETARLAAAFASRDGAASEPCPSPAAIYDAATATSSAHQSTAVVEHIALCAPCALAWRIAVRFDQEAAPVVQPTGSPPATDSRSVSPMRQAVAAALGFTALGLGLIQFDSHLTGVQSDREPVYRDLVVPAAIRLIERQHLPRQAFILRWQGPQGPHGYTLRITDARLAPVLVQRNLSANQYQVPAAALATLDSGELLYWQVELDLGDNGSLSSATATVVID